MRKSKKRLAQMQAEEHKAGGFKFSWLLWGAAAYYGLKLMSKRGIFPEQSDKALDLINRGISAAKQRAGLGGDQSQVATNY
jgi:hypothetical protein